MSIETVLEKLQVRNMKFSTFKAALNRNNLPTSNGWANLGRKFEDLNLSIAEQESHENKLEKIYRENIAWGDKAVQFATFKVAQKPLLEELFSHSYVPDFIPENSFPAPATANDLTELVTKPKLVATRINAPEQEVTLYFYARAYESLREHFSVDQMTDEVSKARFAGFDEVVALKQIIYLRVDSICINVTERRIEFRVDATRLTSIDRMTEALTLLKQAFREFASGQVNSLWENLEISLVNFFPKIQDMYNGDQGTLVQLGHNTPAGAINHGKMRGLLGDMKSDPSHTASMAASVNEKFSIKKSYSYYSGFSNALLSIPGKSADMLSVPPTINTALAEDCINKSQFDDLMIILR